MMPVRAKYVVEFAIKKGRIRSSRVIGLEYATEAQQKAIVTASPMLRAFVNSRLSNEAQFQDCTVNVRVSFIETARGLELTFKV